MLVNVKQLKYKEKNCVSRFKIRYKQINFPINR